MFKDQKNSKIILRPTFINTLYQILQYNSADDAYKYYVNYLFYFVQIFADDY